MPSVLDRIKGLNAQIAVIESQIDQSTAEVSMLEHINDDAQRDAAVTERYEDIADANMTDGDVKRIRSHIRAMEKDRSKLVAKRDRLVRKLAAG
ncbi:MAG: hypothetical protein ABFR95_09755 [Actinomycetota bacterium]